MLPEKAFTKIEERIQRGAIISIIEITNGSIEEFCADELNGRGEPGRFSWVKRG
tara:strand:- start:610 stop:771 length:162 start_codon:yes stop_codon:yes gene_type:complete